MAGEQGANQNTNQNGGEGNQNTSGEGNQNNGGENNNEITTPLHTGLWDNPSNETDGEGNQNTGGEGNQNQNQNQGSKTPDEIMQEHIASLGLTSNLDVEGLIEALNQGDTKPLVSAIETAAANSYKAAVNSLSGLMDQKINAAVEKATAQAEGNVNSNMALREMHAALPFTDAPDLAPVADAVMTKLINNGKTVSEAIKGTNDFFKAITEQGMNHFDTMQNQRPGQSDPRRQQSNQTDEYWSDLLQGISESN